MGYGIYNVNSSLFFEFDADGRRAQLFKRRSRLDVRKFMFAELSISGIVCLKLA